MSGVLKLYFSLYKFKHPELVPEKGLQNYKSSESWDDIPTITSQMTFKAEDLRAKAPHSV